MHTHALAFTPLLNTWLPRRRQSIFATAATLYSSKTTTVVVVVLWLSPPFHSLTHSLSHPLSFPLSPHSLTLFQSLSLPLSFFTTLSFSRSRSHELYMCATRSCRWHTREDLRPDLSLLFISTPTGILWYRYDIHLDSIFFLAIYHLIFTINLYDYMYIYHIIYIVYNRYK